MYITDFVHLLGLLAVIVIFEGSLEPHWAGEGTS